MTTEVAIIGGGIIGTSAAAFLAEGGARVTLVERDELAAGASGRNLGAVQHPFDPVLGPLFHETVAIYAAMAATTPSFAFSSTPAGVLMLAAEPGALASSLDDFAATPELQPVLLNPAEVHALEPMLAPDLWAIRLETGHPVPPQLATEAMAARARTAGARLMTGVAATPIVGGGRALGIDLEGARHLPADLVLLAAGPWTPFLLDPSGSWRPIVSTWGATAQLAMDEPPRHIVEEARVDSVNRPAATGEAPNHAATGDEATPSMFTLAAAAGIALIGSTFLPAEPDHRRLAPILVERGRRWLPALAEARIVGTRACARPQSIDGRPFLGPIDGVTGLYVAAGHGPWGISTGPATARRVTDLMLNLASSPIPPSLQASRLEPPLLREVPA